MKIVLANFAAIAALAAVAFAPNAHAAPDPSVGPGCDTVPWGFLGHQRRTICDGPIEPGGGWERKRSIWTPAHQVPLSTTCSGGAYSSYCTTYGGYFVDMSIDDQQEYPVTPDTVLPDEPGHLG